MERASKFIASFTPRAWWTACGVALLLVGCGPAEQSVYVDLNRVRKVPMDGIVLADPQPPSIAPLPASQGTMPSLPASRVDNLAEKRAQLLEEQQVDLEIALDRYSERIEKSYDALVRQYRLDEDAQLAIDLDKPLATFLEKLRRSFVTAAEKRAPLITRWTFLTGEGNIVKDLPPLDEGASMTQKRHRKEAEELAVQITALDKAFRDEVNLLTRTYELNRQKLSSDRDTRIGAYKGDLIKRGQDLADALKREIEKRVISQEEIGSLEFEALSSEVVQSAAVRSGVVGPDVPATDSPFPAKANPPRNLRLQRELAEEEIRADLQVWVKLNAYRLANSPAQGRDATDEFRQWRFNRNLGPSAR